MTSITRTATASSADPVTSITVTPDASAATSEQASNFFGADGPSFSDVLDIINPLNQIPIVSTLFEEATGHKATAASKLAGGALFGGPLGFAASLAGQVFAQATGKDISETVVAALSGDAATTQLASTATTPNTQVADASDVIPSAAQMVESRDLPAPQKTSTAQAKAVLDLYGASAPSASRAYQKAQMMSYLKEVNRTQVL